MITPFLEKLVLENYNALWAFAMKKRREFANLDDPMKSAWDATALHYDCAGATGAEIGEMVMKFKVEHARSARSKQKRSMERAIAKIPKGCRSELQVLEAEKIAIEKRIKQLQNDLFSGRYLFISKTKDPEMFRVRARSFITKNAITVAVLHKEQANDLARLLDNLIDGYVNANPGGLQEPQTTAPIV
jgi:hypothetical protein